MDENDRAAEWEMLSNVRRSRSTGELQAPLSMTILANDEVVINDLGNRAFITFSPTGEFVRSVPHPTGTGMPPGSVHAHRSAS